MGMELHGVAHDIGHFVITPVIHPLHGMQDAPLHRLEPVDDVRHGTFQNHVGGIIQEPMLVHPTQVVRDAIPARIFRMIVRMHTIFPVGSRVRGCPFVFVFAHNWVTDISFNAKIAF